MNATSNLPHHQRNHIAALKDPDTRTLVNQVAKAWDELDLAARAERIHELVTRGCSLRGLARELDRSEASLRWYRKIGALSAGEREDVRHGRSSARRILLADRERHLKEALRERQRLEEETGAASTLLAQVARQWLNEQGFASPSGFLEQFLLEADRRLWKIAEPTIDTAIPLDLSAITKVIEACKPAGKRPTYAPDLLEYMLSWFLSWLMKAAPERSIRSRLMTRLKRPYNI